MNHDYSSQIPDDKVDLATDLGQMPLEIVDT